MSKRSLTRKLCLLCVVVFVGLTGCKGGGSSIPKTIDYPSWFTPGSYVNDDETIKFGFTKTDVSVYMDIPGTDSDVNTIIRAEDLEFTNDVPDNYVGFTLKIREDNNTLWIYVYKNKNDSYSVQIEMSMRGDYGNFDHLDLGWFDLLRE